MKKSSKNVKSGSSRSTSRPAAPNEATARNNPATDQEENLAQAEK